MKNKFLVATAVMVVTAAPALAASIDVGSAITGSLQEIITTAVTTLVAALIGWIAMVAKKKWNIDIEAAQREALTTFLQRQASSLVAAGAVKLNGVKIEVQNEALAAAANTAFQAIPGVLKFFDLTPVRIQQMIVDFIPKQPAVAQAAAIAIDVQNPGTPSSAS